MDFRRKPAIEGMCVVAACTLLLFVGCKEETTGPQSGPSNVIRGYPVGQGGCVPEVITSSSESADTILTTFTIGEASCRPNLVQWGIDMADPMGVDTPQGNAFFNIESPSRYPAANMPSPSHFAYGAPFSVAQVMIEFDPPVKSVEFYYSRLTPMTAIWNGVHVEADSMEVMAMSREPGTLFYTTYSRKVLYSNVAPGSTAFDTWTYAKFTAPSDKIQWMWFNGRIVIDDLKITRVPLTCTPATVVRGQTVSCVLSSPKWNVTGWDFTPDGAGGIAAAAAQSRVAGTEDLALSTTADSSSLPPVHESSTSKVWSGIAVVSGVVTVSVTDGTTSRTYQANVAVTDRASPWKSTWTYRQGPEQTVADQELTSSSVAFGRNCPEQHVIESDCTSQFWLRVQPDPRITPGAGYTTAQIASGPQKGYWYVSSILYNMKRVGNVHPGMLATSPRTHPVPASALTKDCKRGLGLSPKATTGQANMNQFNQYCSPPTALGTDMTVFVPAIWGHEGFGYNGGVGHETLGQQAAGEPQNDPYKAIENLVSTDAASLASAVDTRVQPIADDITLKAADGPNGPHGNYDPTAFPTREMWFWELGSTGTLTWVRRPLTSKY